MEVTKSSKGYVVSLRNGRRLVIAMPEKGVFRVFDERAKGTAKPLIPLRFRKEQNGIRFIHLSRSLYIDDEGMFEFKKGHFVVMKATLLSMAKISENSFDEGHEGEREAFAGTDGLVFESKGPIYGLGDKTGPLDKTGYSYINWNTDDPSAQVDTFKSLYKSIPFFVLFGYPSSLGVYLDNTGRTYFDFAKKDRKKVISSFQEGYFDFYFFSGSFVHVSESFSTFVGTPPLPPRWSLGYQQSRWSYGSKDEVERVIENYRKIDVPVSAVHLDIAYMVLFEDFTIDEKRFPDFSRWSDDLLSRGVHLVTIIDAGVKALPGYFLYDEGLKNKYFSTLKGRVYHNEVWPGDSVFPSFIDEKTQQWWAHHVSLFLTKGVSGIWNDMNEPASFKGPLPLDVDMGGLPHSLAHNIYGDRMAQATAKGFLDLKRRPFIITRAAYATTAHYSTMWTGDNQSIWDHLRLTIPQMCGLSISGVQMIGNDIGGFSGDTTKELLIRWIQLGTFSPLMRNHSAYGTRMQEGYAFDEETSRLYSKAVHLRYELIPYFYDLLHEAETKGTPLYRPLIMNFPSNERLWNENTEFMIGDALLVAPSLYPGERSRSVYFPSEFFDFRHGKRFEKGDHLISVELNEIPLFVKKGTIVPLAEKHTSSPEFGSVLRLLVTRGNSEYVHFEDAGDGLAYKNGEFNLIRLEKKGPKFFVSYLHHGMKSHYQKIQLVNLKGRVKNIDFKF